MDYSLGKRGLLTYLKSLGGSNIVKITPSNGETGKSLKVECGTNTHSIPDSQWITDKTPMTLCQVKISPRYSIKPNVGSLELSEALARVLPFVAKADDRPILQCVSFEAKDGKLALVSADGFRLATIELDFEGEGNASIAGDDLKGIANVLKKSRRTRLSFDDGEASVKALTIETECIRYKWVSVEGTFPDWRKLIPSQSETFISFDTVEAIKAINSLKSLADDKVYSVDLTLADGKVVFANTDGRGQAELPADIVGQGSIRVQGDYLTSALRACGGIAQMMLQNSYSPMLFTTDGYRVVLMPMLSDKSNAEQRAAKVQAEPQPKVKAQSSRAKEPVKSQKNA